MNTMLSGALELISGPLKNILDQLGGAKNELWLEIHQLMSRMTPERILAALKADIAGPVKLEIIPPSPLIIDRSTPFNPTTFVGNGWTIWKGPANGKGLEGDEEQDAHSLLLTKIDFTKLTKKDNFLTGLEGSETVVTGEVKRARLITNAYSNQIQADARIGQALFEEEGQKTLRFLHDTLGVTWLEFLGTTLRGSGGHRCALCLYRRDDGSWVWGCRWLDFDRSAAGPALSLK